SRLGAGCRKNAKGLQGFCPRLCVTASSGDRWTRRMRRFFQDASFFLSGSELGQLDALAYDLAHLLLKFVYLHRAVHQNEIVGVDHLIVIVQNPLLKDAEAFGAIERNAQVHSSFVIFELGAAGDDAIYGDVERRAEIKRDVGNRREAVKISQPVGRAATSGVARKSGVDIAVGKDEIAAVKQG